MFIIIIASCYKLVIDLFLEAGLEEGDEIAVQHSLSEQLVEQYSLDYSYTAGEILTFNSENLSCLDSGSIKEFIEQYKEIKESITKFEINI